MATIYVNQEVHQGLSPRLDKDSYLTDPVLAYAALEWLNRTEDQAPSVRRILDPGAGSGVWGEAARWSFSKRTKLSPAIDGVELRRKKNPGYYDNWFPRQDFLKWNGSGLYDLVIGNPPFKLAEAFVRRSLDMLMPTGRICFLLPVDFAHSIGRSQGLFFDFTPSRIAALAERPQFRGPDGQDLGNANPNNYVLMVWHRNPPINHTLWETLSWKKTKK